MRLPTRWLALAACTGFVIAGCTCGKKPSAPETPQQPSATSPSQPSSQPAQEQASSQPPAPRQSQELWPAFMPVGEMGAIPTKLVVRLQRDVFGGMQVGAAPKGTVLMLKPKVDGKLEITSPSELTFTPTTSFAPGTQYQVRLESVTTPQGTLKSDAWKDSFATPEFALLRLAQNRADVTARVLELDLIFSGPVDYTDVRRLVTWTFNDAPATPTKFDVPQPNVVRATFSTDKALVATTIKATLAEGLPMKGQKVTARAAESSLSIELGKPLTIESASRGESTTGFYVEVSCFSEVSKEGMKDLSLGRVEYRWTGRNNNPYIRRCIPDESTAAQQIHFSPKVTVSVAPSQTGFRIFGDFKRGTYKLRIDAGLRALDGSVLTNAFETQLDMPARSPKISFASDGRYLPRAAWKRLAVRHLNVSEAMLTIRQVPPENLVFWMTEPSETFTDRTSNLVVNAVKVPLEARPDELGTSFVDLAALAPAAPKGLLEIQLAYQNTRDARRLLLTDLNLVAKKRAPPPAEPWRHTVDVWALEMGSNEQVSGVEARLIRKSGFVLGTCKTGGDGRCRIEVEKKDADPSPPFALVAAKDADLTYLKFEDLKTEISDTAVSGEPYTSEKPYRAALYSDRGVYRPGETVHLVAILRDKDDAAPPEGMPVMAKIVDPRQNVFKTVTLKTNAAGIVAFDPAFPPFASTGHYVFSVEIAGKAAGSYDFQIEEFVPERMKVDVAFEKPDALFGADVAARVEARYLFGGVPSKHKVELTCELAPATFTPKENSQLTYGTWRPADRPRRGIALGQKSSELDDAGKKALTCPRELSPGSAPESTSRLVASAAVFEAGSGRTTVGKGSMLVHPEKFYVGLTSSAQKLDAGKAFPVQGAVVDWNGALLAKGVTEVKLDLIRLEEDYTWLYDEASGGGSYKVSFRPMQDQSMKVKVEGGKFTATFTPTQDAAGFLVRATAGKARTELHLEGQRNYWYEDYEGPQQQVERTPRPARPAWLALDTPERIKVGEPVTVKLKAPYAGRALLSIETNEVLKAEWKDVKAGEASWTFTLDKFVPNVYVSALVVKDPHLDSKEAFLPDRAFGVKSVKVDPVEFRHTVKLDAPNEVRSNSKLTVKLDLGAPEEGAFATVAVVDEGILSLTQFKTPAPLDALFAARALGIDTYETVGWALALPAAGPSRSTGGDGEGSGGQAPGRVQPVKPVALWSGVVPIGKDGKASVTFNVPQYRGKLRVMAVTSGKKRVGSAEASVLVRDPIVVQTTMPRFLVHGDEIQIPVFLTNLSGAKQEVKLSLETEVLQVPGMTPAPDEPAPLKLLGKREATLTIANGASATAVFQAKAVRPVGAAKLKVVARAGNMELHDEADVPFVPAGPRERKLQRIELAKGTNDLKPYLTGWMPTSEQSTFWVTTNPYGEAFDHLKYLVHYPYG